MGKSSSSKKRKRERQSRHTEERNRQKQSAHSKSSSAKHARHGSGKNRGSEKVREDEAIRESNGADDGVAKQAIKWGNGPALEEAADSESRKRSRRHLDFVYPKKNGLELPYRFEMEPTNGDAKQKSSSAEESANAQQLLTPKSKNTGSIDDILSSSKSKKQKKAPSPENYASRPSDMAVEGKISGVSVVEAMSDKSRLRPRANSTDGELNLPMGGLCDEFMVLQTHKWNLGGHMFRASPRGFVNMGNTCFLNSTLQCLAYLPPFCQSIIAMPDRVSNGDNGNKMSQGKRITMMLRTLFQKIHGGGRGQGESHGAIAPNAIVKAVPNLGTYGSKNGHKFRPGRQEDAHEFLIHLLDAMHDGELREAGIDQRKSGWRDHLPVPRLDETTYVHRTFGGYLRSQVRCTKCGFCSNTYDPFLDLALEVSRKSITNVQAAFNEFTRKETLDSENRYKCSGCKKRVCATKQLTVFRPPLSLCVQLKRFTFGGGGGGFGGFSYGGGKGGKSGNKVTKSISFPAEMKLPLSDKRSCSYGLTGVVIHVGGSSNSGHYTAYVKKAGASGSNQWYHMDDSFVEAVSEKTVLRQKDAYLLFYSRKEVKLEFPSPPTRGSMTASEATEHAKQRARARSESFSKYEKEQAAISAASRSTGESRPAQAARRKPVVKEKQDQKPGSDSKKEGAMGKPTKPERSDDTSSDDSSVDSSDDDSGAENDKKPPANQKQAPTPTANEVKHNDVSDTTKSASTVKKPTASNKPKSDSSPSDGDDSSNGSSSSGSDSGSEDEAPPRKKPAPDVKPDIVPLSNNKKEKPAANVAGKTTKKKKATVTRVVMDHGSGREKVSVMVNSRIKGKKAWNPKTSGITKSGEEYELLGNREVDKWGDDPESGTAASGEASKISNARTQIVDKMEKKNRVQRRGMFLSSWDAGLDRGRTKKLRTKRDDPPPPTVAGNSFQRILSGLQKIKHVKPKGYSGKESSGHSSQKKRKRHN